MPVYAYRAASAAGRTVRGTEEAATEAALDRLLVERGLFPLEIRSAGGGAARRAGSGAWTSRRADLAESVATLAALLEAGLPLDRALEVTARGAARSDMAQALEGVRQVVRGGGRITDALRAHAELFPPVAVGLLGTAERGGHLAEATRRLADHLERESALRARVVSALIYPALLAGVGLFALVVLLLFVLPRFVELLSDAGAALPASTALLLAASRGFGRWWPLLLLAPCAGGVLWTRWRRSTGGRERADALLLSLPLLGPLRARYASVHVARTLGTLTAGGLTLLQALDVTVSTTGDAAVAADLRAAHGAVRRGEALSAALARGRAFPHVMIRMVQVGEETGELDTLLGRAAGLMEGELGRKVERLVALLEPAMILLFGILVGGVALSLLQAIYGVHADTF